MILMCYQPLSDDIDVVDTVVDVRRNPSSKWVKMGIDFISDL